MRLWIVALLLGGASSNPLLQKQHGSGDGGSNPMWNYWFRGASPDPGGIDASGVGLNTPLSDQAPGSPGSPGTAGDAYDSGYVADRYQYPQETQGGGVVVVAGHPEDEEFFSDIADLEPVYSFNSRSRYQRGRAAFSQTRYIPTEPLEAPVALYEYPSKTPAKARPQGPAQGY